MQVLRVVCFDIRGKRELSRSEITRREARKPYPLVISLFTSLTQFPRPRIMPPPNCCLICLRNSADSAESLLSVGDVIAAAPDRLSIKYYPKKCYNDNPQKKTIKIDRPRICVSISWVFDIDSVNRKDKVCTSLKNRGRYL